MKKNTLNRHRKDLFVILGLTQKVVMDFSYILLSHIDTYKKEFNLNSNIFKIIFSYLAVFIVCGIAKRIKGLNNFLIKIIVFFVIIPLATVFSLQNQNSLFFIAVIVTFVFVEILLAKLPFFNTNSRQTSFCTFSKETTMASRIISIVLFSVTIIAILWMFALNGLPTTTALSLDNVYLVRDNYISDKYLKYIVSIVTLIAVPYGIAEGYTKKSPLVVLFFISAQILLFLWTGNKTWLFSIMIISCVLFLLIFKIKTNFFFLGVVLGSFLGSILCYNNAFSENIIFSMLNRRMLLDPAALKFFYFDYFIIKGHPIVGVSGTLLAPLFSFDSETLKYAYDISVIYTGVSSNAGTGIYGGDIANIGIFSFVVTPLLLFFWFYLSKRHEDRSGFNHSLIMFVYLTYTLNDQRLFTLFLDLPGITLMIVGLLYKVAKIFVFDKKLALKKTRQLMHE